MMIELSLDRNASYGALNLFSMKLIHPHPLFFFLFLYCSAFVSHVRGRTFFLVGEMLAAFSLFRYLPFTRQAHILGRFSFRFFSSLGSSFHLSSTLNVVDDVDSKKIVTFSFVQFREH